MAGETGREFMRATRHENMPAGDQQRGLPAPPLLAMLGEISEKITLPEPGEMEFPGADFSALVESRRSRRRYAKESLTLAELSYLLWCTQGVQEVHGRMASLRTVPSAGARHALETLVLARRVADLAPGLCQYDPFSHRLLRIGAADGLGERVTEACYDQHCVASGAALLIWVAIPYRMTWRYGERGYRYLHLDAGHVCQNLYLGAEALGLSTVAVAAFDDAALDEALGLDGEERFAIYLAPVGRRSGQTE